VVLLMATGDVHWAAARPGETAASRRDHNGRQDRALALLVTIGDVRRAAARPPDAQQLAGATVTIEALALSVAIGSVRRAAARPGGATARRRDRHDRGPGAVGGDRQRAPGSSAARGGQQLAGAGTIVRIEALALSVAIGGVRRAEARRGRAQQLAGVAAVEALALRVAIGGVRRAEA
jgi:hypothetical protein